MNTSRWRTLALPASIAGAIALLVWLGLGLWPPEPTFDEHPDLGPKIGDYQPGGSECRPAQVQTLPPTEEGRRIRDACAAAEDQQRLAEHDLLQQARSARAAEQGVWLAYNQSLTLLAGTVISGLVLIAAIAAAVFARRASNYSGEALTHEKEVAEANLRPWLSLEFSNASGQFSPGLEVSFDVTIRNVGKSAARAIAIHIDREMVNIGRPGPENDARIDAKLRAAKDAAGVGLQLLPNAVHTQNFSTNFAREEWHVIRAPEGYADSMIPVLIAAVDYEWGDGRKGRSAQSTVVRMKLPGLEKPCAVVVSNEAFDFTLVVGEGNGRSYVS